MEETDLDVPSFDDEDIDFEEACEQVFRDRADTSILDSDYFV